MPSRMTSRAPAWPWTSSKLFTVERLEERRLLSTNSVVCSDDQTTDSSGYPAYQTYLEQHPEFAQTVTQGANSGSSGVSDVALNELPKLHSFSGAPAKVFLDFDGNFESTWGGNANVLTPPFDIDGDPTTFNEQEQARIHEVWARVAEDYAPFNVDVTTEDPSDANTVLRQAVGVSQRTRTFYFRHEFAVNDVNAITDLQVRLLRDDGAAVYLNGVQIVRDNLPENAEFDDFASGTVGGSDESKFFDFPVDPTILVYGRNALSVEVHQGSDTSSDVSFDLALDATVNGVVEQLVSAGALWKYLDDGSDQGVIWRATDFDDSSWPIGRAQLGYGDADEQTTLLVRPIGTGRTRTFYFRKQFVATNVDGLSQLEIGLIRDDGAAVYLNGVEVIRDNLPVNATFDQFASSTVAGDNESVFFPFEVDLSLLQEGENILAVEVHQASDTSSDVSFDLRMTATNQQGQLELVSAGSDWKFLDDGSDQGTNWREEVFDDGTWPNGSSQFGYGDAPGTVHVAIGPEDWFDEDSAGGVAFVGSFNRYGRTVVYSFTNGAGLSAKNIAEVSSHESGHAFGLRHQSLFDDTGQKTEEYNPGNSGWAPIMGVSYSPLLTTWHDGPSGSSQNLQDDMSILASASNGFRYRDDDHGDSHADATPLVLGAETSFEVSGIVAENSDRDVFSFSLNAGQQSFSANLAGAPFGSNLNAVLELRDRNGALVAMDDPANSLGAILDLMLDPGDYQLVVRSNGGYGRVGQYTITGDIDEPAISLPLERVGVLGSLAKANTNTRGKINFADDEDRFSVFAQRDEFISLSVIPDDAAVSLTVRLDRLNLVAAGAPGMPVSFSAIPVPASGNYDIVVSSTHVTDYQVSAGLNVVFESEDSDVIHPLSIDASRLLSAANRLAAVGFSRKPNSQVDVVSRSDVWRYWDRGTDPGDSWYTQGFDDTKWLTDNAEFGYGDGDEETAVRQRTANGLRNRAFYFRKQFDIDASTVTAATMDIKYDDGVAVYLNGIELFRENLIEDASHRTLAFSTRSNESTYETFVVDTSLLVDGANILAVEVHQASDTSSDVSMDASLHLKTYVPDIDLLTFSLGADQVGQTIQLLLDGNDIDFSEASMELIAPDQTVVATATLHEAAQDLAILSFEVLQAGTYAVQLASGLKGVYSLTVILGQHFDAEFEATATDTLGVLRPNAKVFGYVGGSDVSDRWGIDVAKDQVWGFLMETPLNEPDAVPENNLDPGVFITRADGHFVGLDTSSSEDGNALTHFRAEQTGRHDVQVYAKTGTGEYSLSVISAGDANVDGAVGFHDFVTLTNHFGNAGDWFDGDFDGDGVVGFGDFLLMANNFGQPVG